MKNLLHLEGLKRRRPPSVLLGLTLDGGRLEAVVLRRTNGSLQRPRECVAPLSLDLLTDAAELAGREIRNQLDAAGIRERRCVVGVPLKWMLTAHVTVPDLPEADAASFLQLQAERSFPCDVETLSVAWSCCRLPSGERYATLVGIPRNHLNRLEQVLHAAQLKPVSFSLGLSALQTTEPESSPGVLALEIGRSHIGLQITAGGGVAALRALEGAMDAEGGQRLPYADVVAREIRITLGQLPTDLRDAVQRVRLFGSQDLAEKFGGEVRSRLEAAGLQVESAREYPAGEFGVQLPSPTTISPAFSLAAGPLTGRGTVFEFLPPKVSAWQQTVARYSSGGMQKAGLAAAAVVLLVVGSFAVQQWQLSRLESRWAGMATRVHELETIQQRIQKFRPWFDNALPRLSLLRQLTEAFPQDGVVTAKTLEIRDSADVPGESIVSCSGTARASQALQQTLERLRHAPGVSDLAMGPIRGNAPMQFTFNFNWNEGAQHAN